MSTSEREFFGFFSSSYRFAFKSSSNSANSFAKSSLEDATGAEAVVEEEEAGVGAIEAVTLGGVESL